jgi:hypothetical protein
MALRDSPDSLVGMAARGDGENGRKARLLAGRQAGSRCREPEAGPNGKGP